jgi:4-carboxymuconolactone decarboxylase
MAIKGPARIEPLAVDQLPEWMQNGPDILRVNIMKTLAHHEDLLKPWNRFAGHIMGFTSTLNGREREILILRTGWNHQSDYEWGQHVIIGRKSGLNDEEINAIATWPKGGNWTEQEKLLLQATDELFRNSEIGDVTWEALSKHYDKKQLLDIVFTVGQYTLVCYTLKTCRVQLDDGVGGLPAV